MDGVDFMDKFDEAIDRYMELQGRGDDSGSGLEARVIVEMMFRAGDGDGGYWEIAGQQAVSDESRSYRKDMSGG